MSKKIIIFALGILMLIFFLLFVFPYIRIQKGITLYNNSDFTWAQSQFLSSNFPDTKEESLYNIWTTLYKQKNYTGAFLYFHSTASWNLELNSLYNLWNTAYLLWAAKNDTDEKLSLWNQSLGFYSWALDKKESVETRENYEYVKKKIEELQNTEEKEQKSSEQEKDTDQKEQKNSSQTGSSSEDSSKDMQNWDTSSSKQKSNSNDSKEVDSSSKKAQSSQRDPQYQLKQWDGVWELSPFEWREIESRKLFLEESQKRYMEFYNKKPSSQEGGDIFENFTNPFTWEPFFQDNLHQSEKDW
jgi:hypothetical protein